MITLKYRLVGSVTNPILAKEFYTRETLDRWVVAQGNILVVEIESSGANALNRVFG